jgi:PAS domain S-box-containing protein
MGKIIKNIITGKEIVKPEPINEEVPFDGGVMITETDTAGIITYANRKFREMTGYSKEELIGSPHSINRHPDMPKVAFKGMWEMIKSGEYWQGYVKNMRKDGKYYLVIVWIKPKFDEDGNIIGYIAGRKIPNKEKMITALNIYKNLKSAEVS